MIRKYDYLQEKEIEQPYNFVQECTELSEDFGFVPQHDSKKKSRSMHITISHGETPIFYRNLKRKSRERHYNKYMHQSIGKFEDAQNPSQRNNFIYHKTIDRFKEQVCSIRIKQGMQQIHNHAKMPKLIPSLSSNKKISSLSEKQVSGMQRRLKNRLQLVQKLKSLSKAKPPVANLAVEKATTTKESIRQTLQKRINDINKIVCQDAGSINLKIQEMDPINQMHRIRMIVEKGHKEFKLVSDQQHDNIEENIFEVRQLMRKYLKEG